MSRERVLGQGGASGAVPAMDAALEGEVLPWLLWDPLRGQGLTLAGAVAFTDALRVSDVTGTG